MTGNERRIKRRIQLIVTGAMFVMFALSVTLVIQLGVMANQRRMERSLNNANAQLQAQLVTEHGLREFMLSDRFIDEFALRELGHGRDGAQIFQ